MVGAPLIGEEYLVEIEAEADLLVNLKTINCLNP
jgi:hypothetical protein